MVQNTRAIIAVNRNLGFLTNGYNYLIQLVPLLIVAPLYLRGEIEFGVVTQSAMAFATVLGAFSLIVTQFDTLSTFAAVTERLNTVAGAIEQGRGPRLRWPLRSWKMTSDWPSRNSRSGHLRNTRC